MFFRTTYFLRKIKRAQLALDKQVYIDREGHSFITMNAEQSEIRVVKIKCFWSSLDHSLAYLKQKGLAAIRLDKDIVALNEKGFYKTFQGVKGIIYYLLGAVSSALIERIIEAIV